MPVKTKAQLIVELTARGVKFNANDKYNDLSLLLKKAPVSTIPAEYIDRAKVLGMTDEQIATYSDPVILKMACDQIKPQATAYSVEKKPVPVRRQFTGEPAQATCVIEITETRATHVHRCNYDEGQLGDFCRRQRIDVASIEKLTFIRDCLPDKRRYLTTTVIIDYRKGK